MAKKKTPNGRQPTWKTRWPRGGDLASWFRCMLQKCDAIEDPANAADTAHLPIEGLAELGHVTTALRAVNRHLRRLGKGDRVAIVRMAELGAEICLNEDDLAGMEKYLSRALAVEKLVTRKCDIGFPTNSVRDFRADHGLLDPADAIDDEQRVTAKFYGARRRFRQARSSRSTRRWKAAVADMEAAAFEAATDWQRSSYLRTVIETYAKLGDADSVQRCAKRLSGPERDEILDRRALWLGGLREQARKRSVKEIKGCLAELSVMRSPNIHFPIRAIRDELLFLHENEQQPTARRWLKRVLKEADSWPVYEFGWTTSAVCTMLAEAVGKIEGVEAAERLLESAYADGRAEKRPGSRRAAVGSAIKLQASLGQWDEALAEARKIRSPTEKRKQLSKLLARARRWKELREVLCQVQTPQEAADLCWWIKFELPSGEPR